MPVEAVGCLAQNEIDLHLARGGGEVADLDLDAYLAPLLGPPLAGDAQHGQIGQALRRPDRLKLDVNVLRQSSEIDGGPVGALEIADDDEFTPPLRTAGV